MNDFEYINEEEEDDLTVVRQILKFMEVAG